MDTTTIFVSTQIVNEQLGWQWRVFDDAEQLLAMEHGTVLSMANPIEALATATTGALLWAQTHEVMDVVIASDDQQFVAYVSEQAAPSPYLAVLIAPILPLLAEVGGRVIYAASPESAQLTSADVPPPLGSPTAKPSAQQQAANAVARWLDDWPVIRTDIARLIEHHDDTPNVYVGLLNDLDAIIEPLAALTRAIVARDA